MIGLSQIIMALEQIDVDDENRLAKPEELAQRLETAAEQLFRLAGRVRHGREGT